MGYEVDFLAVGDKGRSGDAIAMRFGNLHGQRNEQTVIVIDGGFKNNTQDLVGVVKNRYGTKSVDLVISTHPHEDHISGLHDIVESGELQIHNLWMHQPWKYPVADEWQPLVASAKSLCVEAEKRGIATAVPWPNGIIQRLGGTIQILGPSPDYYESLLLESPGALKEEKHEESNTEEWWEDTITDDAKTSAVNNTSTIVMVTIDAGNGSRKFVFTGDAGIDALAQANIPLMSGCDVLQIPHHGSKHNVGPTILNSIVGGIVPENTQPQGAYAIASCALEGEPKHPNQRVINAFVRRGAKCYATQGSYLRFNSAPTNNPARRLGFSSCVKDD